MRGHLKRLEEDYESVLSQLNERSETLDEAIKELSNQKVNETLAGIQFMDEKTLNSNKKRFQIHKQILEYEIVAIKT